MAGLDPAIHALTANAGATKAWMPGTRPGMTRIRILVAPEPWG
jgi:hypothetical protein